MTSFIAACGSCRFTSFIPAVPAAWSVTTIAFMIICSSVMLTPAPTKPGGSGSLRSRVLANRCAASGHKNSTKTADSGCTIAPMATLPIQLDRARSSPLAAQIYSAIREGIENGRLASGARLPSWQDLAAQLGVSRGTVRVAYERLIAEQFAVGLGPAGTRVAERQSRSSIPDGSPEAPLLPDLFYEFRNAPLPFQMGVPAQDPFPFKLWSRILTRETRRAATAPVTYPDPLGDPELRKEVAAYLGLARGVRCNPSQVLITGGFSGALGLAIRGLQLGRMEAWNEDPGFPLTRTALDLAGIAVRAVPVDAEGMDVAVGLQTAAGAKLAVVTPGQQAPLGVTMSLPRRLALLAWARRSDAWIIEDDYLSEPQLKG